eukprot:GHVS01051105.1.p1 GENE.GHVS01051105.1~~GHVS01051105.1.p1  ORF type:complete len:533 (+),score=77.92 GHVS01051105.1:106-1704(+)
MLLPLFMSLWRRSIYFIILSFVLTVCCPLTPSYLNSNTSLLFAISLDTDTTEPMGLCHRWTNYWSSLSSLKRYLPSTVYSSSSPFSFCLSNNNSIGSLQLSPPTTLSQRQQQPTEYTSNKTSRDSLQSLAAYTRRLFPFFTRSSTNSSPPPPLSTVMSVAVPPSVPLDDTQQQLPPQSPQPWWSCWPEQWGDHLDSFFNRPAVKRTSEYISVGVDATTSLVATTVYLVVDLNSFISKSLACSFWSAPTVQQPSCTDKTVVAATPRQPSADIWEERDDDDRKVPTLHFIAECRQRGLTVIDGICVGFSQFVQLSRELVTGDWMEQRNVEKDMELFLTSAKVSCVKKGSAARQPRRGRSVSCLGCRWAGVFCNSCTSKFAETWKPFFAFVVATSFMTVVSRGGEKLEDLQWCRATPTRMEMYPRRFLAEDSVRWIGEVAEASLNALRKDYDLKNDREGGWNSLCDETSELIASLAVVEKLGGGQMDGVSVSVGIMANEQLGIGGRHHELVEHLHEFCVRLVLGTQVKYRFNKYW